MKTAIDNLHIIIAFDPKWSTGRLQDLTRHTDAEPTSKVVPWGNSSTFPLLEVVVPDVTIICSLVSFSEANLVFLYVCAGLFVQLFTVVHNLASKTNASEA